MHFVGTRTNFEEENQCMRAQRRVSGGNCK